MEMDEAGDTLCKRGYGSSKIRILAPVTLSRTLDIVIIAFRHTACVNYNSATVEAADNTQL